VVRKHLVVAANPPIQRRMPGAVRFIDPGTGRPRGIGR
jgi:hypothetical protein